MLEGRCIVVTGASGALGSAVCARLLRGGARVVALVHKEAARAPLLGALAGAEPSAGERVEAVVAELASEVSVEAAYDAAAQRFGTLWGSVHCAGGWAGGTPLSETSVEAFEQMIALNLRSTFLASRAAARRMGAGGRIVNVAAYYPAIGSGLAGASAYAASKAAVIALTQALAEEGVASGLRASCVAPAGMLTAANARGLSPEQQRALVPLEDVAEAIAFLCSRESGALSGSVLKFPPLG